MYFQNELVLTDPPSGIDSSAKYCIGWGTRGIVIETSQFDACYETLANCLWSMDNTKMVENVEAAMRRASPAIPRTQRASSIPLRALTKSGALKTARSIFPLPLAAARAARCTRTTWRPAPLPMA